MKKARSIGHRGLLIALFSWLVLLVCTLCSWAFDPTSPWVTFFISIAFLSAIGALLSIGMGMVSIWRRDDIWNGGNWYDSFYAVNLIFHPRFFDDAE